AEHTDGDGVRHRLLYTHGLALAAVTGGRAAGVDAGGRGDLDAHAVEGAPDEYQGDDVEDHGGNEPLRAVPLQAHLLRQLHGQQAEEGGELDDRVNRDRGGVLERVA